MKSFSVVLILLIIPLILHSSTWTRFFDGTAYCVIEDHQGNYVLVGSNSYSGYGQQISVLKYDPEGNQIWNKNYGGTGDEGAFNILMTEDSGYIFSGYTTSSGSGLSDAYIMKLDNNGDSVWSRVYGGIGNDTAFSISRTLDGGYIVGGAYDSLGYLLRLDTSGDTLWTRTYDSTNAIKYAISGDSAGVEWFICTAKCRSIYGQSRVYRIDSVGNIDWNIHLDFTDFYYDANCRINILPGYRYITATTNECMYFSQPIYWILDKEGNILLGGLLLYQNLIPPTYEDPLTTQTTGNILHSLISYRSYSGGYHERNYIYRYNVLNDSLASVMISYYDGSSFIDFCVTSDSSYVFVGTQTIMKTEYDGSIAVEEPSIENPQPENPTLLYDSKDKTFYLSVQSCTEVYLKVYDLQGRLVDIPISGTLSPGTHQIPFRSERSGIYFYHLESSFGNETGKFMVVR